jgi:hypothetical protein
MNVDSLNIKERKKKKKKQKKEQSFITTIIMTKSDITKPFLTLYLCQHICLTQLSTLADNLLGATIDFEHCQKSRSYLQTCQQASFLIDLIDS